MYLSWVNHFDLGCVLEINVFLYVSALMWHCWMWPTQRSVTLPLFSPFSSTFYSSSSTSSSSSSFSCPSFFFYFFFDNPLKNVKTILSPSAIQTQATDHVCIGTISYSLLTPISNQNCFNLICFSSFVKSL